jgi:hypothetical protein
MLLHHQKPADAVKTVAAPRRIPLSGVGALDPYGPGNREHPERAAAATDHIPSTYWNTETYRGGLAKPGVGLVVQTAAPRVLKTITVASSTPGFTAEIRTATSADGASRPGPVDSASQTVGATTTFTLRGRRSTYWVIWITDLGESSPVRITEVTATG